MKGSVLIRNIGCLVTGDIRNPRRDADSIYIEDGVIQALGGEKDADVIIDAQGTTVIPGLIDSHSHPVFGDFTPLQNTLGWVRSYLHGGVTGLISAGELHLPGLPLFPGDPKISKYLAILARRCWDRLRPSGVKVYGGTLLVTSGHTEADFDELAQEGVRLIKFIFYDYAGAPEGEAQMYVRWAHERGMRVKIHSGGTSRSGVTQPAMADVILKIRPDIAGHITGGPIPVPLEDMKRVIEKTDCYLEIAVLAGNPRSVVELLKMALERQILHRVIFGTDTPSGTGIIPRGMLRGLSFAASLSGVRPEEAVCMATGNVALAHNLATGFLQEGKPADLVIMDRIEGSEGKDALDALARGDIPGISTVLVDGTVWVRGRSEQTPPPARSAQIVKGL